MKNFLLLQLCLSVVVGSNAQHQWAARYNGPASKQDAVRAIVAKGEFVYVAGMSEGKKGNPDYAVVKYDGTGKQLWVARYNGTGNSTDNPFGLDVDDAGNVYVTGGSIGTNGTFDYATVKYNSNGSQQWVRRFETARNDIAKDVEVKGNHVYVTGFADGANQFNGNSIYTVKYDLGGIRKWDDTISMQANIYDGSATNREEGYSLTVDAAGNIYITGVSKSMATFKYQFVDELTYNMQWMRTGAFEFGLGRKILADAAGNVVVTGFAAETIKYSPDGNELWKSTYPGGGGNTVSFWDMAMDPSGNVYVAGRIQISEGVEQYLTVKYNGADGTQAWAKQFGGTFNGSGNAEGVAYASSGTGESIYVTGRSGNKVGRNAIPNIGTVKYDAVSGDQLSAWFYDGPEAQGSSGSEITTDGNGNIYVAGQTTYKTTYIDFTTLKYVDAATTTLNASVLEPGAETHNLRLSSFPNPVNATAFVEFELKQETNTRLALLDNLGREVKVLWNGKRAQGVHRVSFNRHGLAAGTYYYRLQLKGEQVVRKVLITR
jgi:hypothetical protein